MKLKFTKMHGIGNDFVVFNGIHQAVKLTPEQLRYISNRRFGVGCDQILLVESAQTDAADFRYRIFNANGGEVEQCGNGARCFMRFVREQGLSDKDLIRVETLSGIIELQLEADELVRVNMGVPEFEPSLIPFDADSVALSYPLEVDDQTLQIGAVSMGNPHAVLQVDNVQLARVAQLGPIIESHPRFPNQVNVGFMEIVSPDHIRLRVYERGTGETLACGSGACAAVAIGRLHEQLAEKVTVSLPGGELIISWSGNHQPVWMTGSANTVYQGEIEL